MVLVQPVDWIVEADPEGPEVEVIKLTCPRCFNIFWVPKEAWPGHSAIYGTRANRTMDNYIGRSCPYCFSTPHVPQMVIVRARDEPDLVIPRETAVALQMVGYLAYRLESPSGSIFEPMPGITVDKIRRSIVWDHDNGD